MKIIVADTAGFCFGVERAVRIATEGVIESRCVLGSLVHNSEIIAGVKKKGIAFENEPKEVYSEFVISAHGVPSFFDEKLTGKKVLDATCPRVKRVFAIASNCKNDVCFLFVGNSKHVETQNALSYAENYVLLSNDFVDERALSEASKPKYSKYVLAFQTTTRRSIAVAYSEKAKAVFGASVEITNTLCPNVEKRVLESIEIAKRVDSMIVIGDKTSANCKTLYLECKAVNENTFFVENEIKINLEGFGVVGVTAGASVPKSQIERILELLKRLE